MNNLMLLLALICLVCLPIGLIKPSLVIRWGAMEKRNRKKVLKYYGLGFIVTFILFGVTTPKTANTDSKSTKAKIYQDKMSMSKSSIHDQLVSDAGEKFTEEEAQYAMNNLEN